jgi:hypothetical protein
VFGDFNPGAMMDPHDLQRAGRTEADKGTTTGGPTGDAVAAGGWEGYSPDILAALFGGDGWPHADP